MEKEAESVLNNCNPIIKWIENVTNCLEFIFCLKENDRKNFKKSSLLHSQKKEHVFGNETRSRRSSGRTSYSGVLKS